MEVAITKMSENGQVVIPAEVRRDANIGPATKFLVFNEGNDILLKRINKEKLAEDLELIRSLERAEKDIEEGRVVHADTSMTFEEFDKLLME